MGDSSLSKLKSPNFQDNTSFMKSNNKFVEGRYYQAASLEYIEGFSGDEPIEMENRAKRHPKMCRFAIAVNTFYPNLEGGYYRNNDLIKLLHDVIRAINYYVVWSEIAGSNCALPVEPPGPLSLNEEFDILNEQGCHGHLFLWEFNVGGGGDFYKSKVILDFLSTPDFKNIYLLAVKNILSDNIKQAFFGANQKNPCGNI